MIALLLAAAAAAASPTPFRCGAVERPGVATRGGDGIWRGAAIDLCQRAAQGTAIVFRAYRTADDLRDASHDMLMVLSPAEQAIALPAMPAPSGPPLATSRQLLLVRPGTPLHSHADLAGHRICFIIATSAESALDAWTRTNRVAIERVGFQEAVELRDGFDAGYCAAMAVDAQDIPGGADHTAALAPALAEVPLFAVRPGQKR